VDVLESPLFIVKILGFSVFCFSFFMLPLLVVNK